MTTRSRRINCCIMVAMTLLVYINLFNASATYEPTVGELNKAQKAEIITQIKERDPDALIFDTEEDAEAFFKQVADPTSYEISYTETERTPLTRADETIRDYDVRVTQNLVSTLHLCYSYTVTNGGRFFGSLVDEPFVTMNGYHPGTDFDQKSARVTKVDSQHLKARFVVYFKYYIVVKPIQVNSATYEYNISHDIAVGPKISSIQELT